MIKTPTLLLDEFRCKRNIESMANKAKQHRVDFRPHFKTHQSLEIGRWFKEFGVNKIAVSSFKMARYFSEEWDDITVAFPVNLLEIDTINELAEKIQLNILVESEESIHFLKENLRSSVGVFLKIDTGYGRAGVNFADITKINSLLEQISSYDLFRLKGFLAHAGHTYKCRSRKCVLDIHNETLKRLTDLKSRFSDTYPGIINSIGDTPSCSVADHFTGADEIRPGNFVFYDLTQNYIGSNTIDEIAVAMACPIVSIYKERNEIIVYGGGVHFSKDSLDHEMDGTIYGRVVEKKADLWGPVIDGMYVNSLSQEHGIITVPSSKISEYRLGDYLLVLPVHSCMTADLMKAYRCGENKIITMMK